MLSSHSCSSFLVAVTAQEGDRTRKQGRAQEKGQGQEARQGKVEGYQGGGVAMVAMDKVEQSDGR